MSPYQLYDCTINLVPGAPLPAGTNAKLDFSEAYNVVPIHAEDEWKIAFCTQDGQYEYLVMLFGLCNAPAVFQKIVNDIFQDLLDQFIIIYLDSILIYS